MWWIQVIPWTPTEAYIHHLQITLMLFRYLWFVSWWLAMKTKLWRWQLPAKTPLWLCGLSVYYEVTYHFLLSVFYYCEKFRLFIHRKCWNSYSIIILITWVNAACVHCYRSVLPSLELAVRVHGLDPQKMLGNWKILYFHAICLSEMALAFCTVTHCIQLNV